MWSPVRIFITNLVNERIKSAKRIAYDLECYAFFYAFLKSEKQLNMQIYNKQVNQQRIHAQLNYVKTILAKVSFDQSLFKKELIKAIRVLLPHEVDKLKKWCYRHFGQNYAPVLDECFTYG